MSAPSVSSPIRSQSPHYPSPSSTFVPPPSENEEFERIMKLKVESSTVAARSPTRASSQESAQDARTTAEGDHQQTGESTTSPNVTASPQQLSSESDTDGTRAGSELPTAGEGLGVELGDGRMKDELTFDEDDPDLTPRIPQHEDGLDPRRMSTASSLSQPHPLDTPPIPPPSDLLSSSHLPSLVTTDSANHGDPNHRNPTDFPHTNTQIHDLSQPNDLPSHKPSSSSSAASLASGTSGTSSSRSRRRRRRVSPAPPQPQPPPGPPLSIRDFAFQSSDERHVGQGPLRAEIFLARAAAAAEASSDSSNNGWGSAGAGFGLGGTRRFGYGIGDEDEEDEEDDDGYEDEDSDEEREYGEEEPLSAASSTGSFPPPEPAGSRYQIDPEPGVYRALYA